MSAALTLLHWLRRLILALLLIVVTLYLARAFASRTLQPLGPEHRVQLAQEFRADRETSLDWDGYRQLERRIADEARSVLGERTVAGSVLDRHAAGSASNPDEHTTNWNFSYTLQPPRSRGAAVLVHGLSDSPYSVRATAQLMRDHGYTALAARMPGHGFAVGDLRQGRWDDWLAVVRIAVREADRLRADGEPLVLVGYSNGGLLAIRYALDCAERPDTPCPDSLLLLSPAIEVTPAARLAQWHRALSWIGYFERFQWDTVLPEVDPYKFTSFPKSPGREIDRAARALAADLEAYAARLPPILAFQSAVDDTVSTEAVIGLFGRLPSNGSELVVYDVNRSDLAARLMLDPPGDLIRRVERALPIDFSVSIVTNTSSDSNEVAEFRFSGEVGERDRRRLGLAWPPAVFSLSHIAIPFPPDDPVYGLGTDRSMVNLGRAAPRGERAVLSLTPNYFARLRYNPFFDYQHQRIVEWLDAQEARLAARRE